MHSIHTKVYNVIYTFELALTQSETNMHTQIYLQLSSYLKLSIHFFLGLPLHRFPGIPSSYTLLASLSSSIRSTFFLYILCLLLIVSTTASWLRLFFISFLTQSIFVSLPSSSNSASHMPAACSRTAFCTVHVSHPYNRVAITIALNTFLSLILFFPVLLFLLPQ